LYKMSINIFVEIKKNNHFIKNITGFII